MTEPVAPNRDALRIHREVVQLRQAVLQMLDIMEDDKRRSMRSATVFAGLAFGFLIAIIVMAV